MPKPGEPTLRSRRSSATCRSGYDFATPYLRFILSFIGIKDVTFIDAGRLLFETDKLEKARADIAANLSAPLAQAA